MHIYTYIHSNTNIMYRSSLNNCKNGKLICQLKTSKIPGSIDLCIKHL